MREIKFRAWDKSRARMIQPLVDWFVLFTGRVFRDNYCEYESQAAMVNLEDFIQEETEHVILMQYTGIIGVNGFEVYEGDILYEKADDNRHRKSHRRHSVVVWHENGWCRECYNGDMKVNPRINVRDIEPIGNIYENPGLLEEA